MKKETTGKKGKLWLIIALAVVAVLAAVGIVLALTLGGGAGDEGEKIESKLYWNIDRESMIDKESMLTLRKPAADGLYYIRFAVDGEQVELPCADKKLVNKIDFNAVVGLKFDADGIIVDMYPAKDFNTVIVENAYVQNADSDKVLTNSSMTLNGMEIEVDMSNANVYIVEDPRPEVPGRDFTVGAKDEVKLMDTIIAFGDDETSAHTVFVVDRLYDSKVYWRYSAQEFDSTNKVSSRKLADDGYWYMDFLCEGEIVTVRTADQACINAMDGYGVVSCACGLVFDKNGDVVDVFNAGLAVKGSVAANNYDVTAIDGTMVSLTRKLAGAEQGRTYMLNLADEFSVYNVTTTADVFGELTDLQIGDRVYVLADATGKPVQAYITCRLVDSPMYYNVSQSYNSTTKETTRKPDENGWYHITLAVNGKQKEYRCKDKAIMSQIDAYGNKMFGLKLKGDVIVKAYNPECVTGAYSFAANNWVVSVASGIVSTVKADGTAVNGIMDDACEVYDVSGCSEFIGAKTTLREGDRIVAYNTPDATMRYVYVISRKVSGVSLYWNFEKKYNATTGETTRTTDEEGYYVFKMAKCGSAGEKLLKTKDKELASKIDKTGVYALCLKTKGDIITGVYPATAINAGYSRIFGIYVKQKNDDTHYGLVYYTTGAEANLDISEAKIYNVSGVYKKGAGEKTTLQVGDRLMLLYGQSGKAEHIIVYERECGSSAYWQFNPSFNSSAKTTEPDENGYYNYTVTVGGKVKNVKTKDADIAAYVDARTLAFGLKLDGDIIKGAYPAVATKEIAASAQSYYDVTKISGNKITLTRTVPGSTNTGDVQEIDISKAKVYNVSAYAGDDWGKAAKLGIGDRVQTYKNEKNEITLVYIVWENTREAGHKSYCEHCGEEVYWHPYYGTIDFIDKHYYLPADWSQYYSKGWGIQGRETGWDWVLDLNGFTYEATGSYAFAVRGNSTLTIVDTSKAKTGAVTGVGVQIKDAEGNASKYQSSTAGIFQVLDNGTLNLRGGTYTRTVNREITNLRRAGVVMVNSTGTLNIYDGAKLVNNTMDVPLDLTVSEPQTEIRRAPQGGAIYNNGGVVNIYGGEIANNGKIHEDFKEFETVAVGNGGNIFNAAGELNIYGGKISGGWCVGNGGNIYVAGGELNIAGGEICDGTSVNGETNNIIVAADKDVKVNITGGEVTGDFLISSGNTLKISGDPVVSKGENLGLSLGNGVKAKVGTMKKGAKIVISSAGKFTTDFADANAAQAMIDKGYFVSANKENPVYVAGKALACGVARCLNGHTSEAACTAAGCEEEMLYWFAWKASDKLPVTGNYYLTKNVTLNEMAEISDNLNLDLNGYNITRKVTAKQITDGAATYAIKIVAGKKLAIADLSGKNTSTIKTVHPADTSLTGSTGILQVATGADAAIYDGIFDGREMVTESNTSGGILCGGGNLTINGGTFYGWSHKFGASGDTTNGTGGMGTIFGGWSTSVVTINDGTFYGGKTKLGGMFASTGKIIVNDGTFNGDGTEVTHGGLFLVQDNANACLEINGGTFTAPKTNTSGGMIYTTADAGGLNTVKINGGTYTLGKAYNGGFIRFRGAELELTNVTLTGGSATIGDIIAFNSLGTLTIGKDADIAGGIECVAVGEAVGSVVLKDNAKVSVGTNYGLKLAGGMKIDATGLNTNAKVAVNATGGTIITTNFANAAAAKAVIGAIYSADPNYKIVVKGKALKMQPLASIQYSCLYGHTADGVGDCEVAGCGEKILEWKKWTSTTSLPTAGNYYLTQNVTINEVLQPSDELNLNLNGYNITRNVTAQQLADGVSTYVFRSVAGKKLAITDLSDSEGTVKVVHPATANLTVSTGILQVATGSEVGIYGGIFDGRDMVTESAAAGGIFCGGGKLTFNGGTFYGWSHKEGAANGNGSIFGGWSTAEVTVNDGTFYGGKIKQGGMFYTPGKLIINGGTFDGTGTEATHGGLIYMAYNTNSNLEIKGGTFVGGKTYGSGGMIYTEPGTTNVTITGGTFTAGSKANSGGFIRFRGKDMTITGVTLTGFTANSADTIAFESTGNLTIGKNADINGGIIAKAAGTIILKSNAKIGAGTTCGLDLGTATVDLSGLNNNAKIYVSYADTANAFATVADEATAENLVDNQVIVSADPIYKVVADGNKLMMALVNPPRYMCLNGHEGTATGACAESGCDLQYLEWTKWEQTDSLPTSGNFYLDADVEIDARVSMDGNVTLDLNGHNITRVIKAGAADYGIYSTNAKGNLYFTDLSGGTVGVVKTVFDTGVTECNGSGFLCYVGAGYSVTIDNGTYDFSGITTTNSVATGCGPITADGAVNINGGTFYGLIAANGYGGVISGRSASVTTINGGTFYGGKIKQGGMISTAGKLTINGGTFDGNNTSANSQPRTEVTHGGLIYMVNNANSNLEIKGGTFIGGKTYSSGGMIYTEPGVTNVTISGGTFTAGSKAGTGGFIRFRGKDLTLTGVTLTGFTANSADIISFESTGNLTIGENADIDGGIIATAAGTIILKDNAKIGAGTTYALKRGTATLDLSGLADTAKIYITHTEPGVAFAEVADEATAQKLADDGIIVSADNNYIVVNNGNKLTVRENDGWTEWKTTDSLPTQGGKYRLKNHVTVSETVELAGDMEIDLNGFNITRTVTEQEIIDSANTHLFQVPAGMKLTILDSSVVEATDVPGTVKVVLPKDGSDATIATAKTTGIINVATGSEVVINNGIFDGREMVTSSTATGGIFCGGGKLTINDGTFYGWSHTGGAANGGIGTIFGGWSTSELTINNGTFYGGQTKQGGMFASNGKIIINNGIFDGNNSATNTTIDTTKPLTYVTHGGIILAQANNNSYVEINGGTFTAPRTGNSGGIIYVESGNGVVKINGGTFNLSKAANGGFIRFRGKSLDIKGVTLTGATATTGDIIAFNSTGTLTIGQDAVIDGGIQMVSAGKVVLKDNAKVNAGTNYGIKLIDGVTMDITGLNDQAKVYITYSDTTKAFATAADEATATALVTNKIIESADPNYRVIADGKDLKVRVQIQWNEWNAAAAATAYGGAEADNLHLTKLPKSGDYQLTADITLTARHEVSEDLNLNLNGFNVTRKVSSSSADYGIVKVNKGKNLYITDEAALDDPTKQIGTMSTVFDGITTHSKTGYFGYVDGDTTTRGKIVIDNGIFDFSGITTTDATQASGSGAMAIQGEVVINGGTFYGVKKTGGYGTLFSVRTSGILTINGGTFYGGEASRGGVIYNNGTMEVNGGHITGNNTPGGTLPESGKPRATATHGGTIYSTGKLTINGGTITGANTGTSGGTIYATGAVTITGGTINGSVGSNGAVMRAQGALTISGGIINGGKSSTAGKGGIVAQGKVTITGGTFNEDPISTGYGTLYVEAGTNDVSISNATFAGGIQLVSAKSVKLSGDLVVGAGKQYGLKTGSITVDQSGLSTNASVKFD